MHILFIVEFFPPHIGGVEILFANVISGLRRKGYTVTVLTTKFDKTLPSHEIKESGYEIYRVGHNRYDFMLYALYYGYTLAKKADIIHTTTYNGAIPASILGMLAKKKVVITVHEIFGKLWMKFMGWKGVFYRMFEKCIFLFPFAKYICVSDYTRNMLHTVEGISFDKMKTIYNGIDYTIWNPIGLEDQSTDIRKQYKLEDKFVGFFFGRPGISKGLEYYIKAIPAIVSKIPDFVAFLLVSKDDKARYDYIRRIAKELGVEQHIIRSNKVQYNLLPTYVMMADFTIVPSLTEGFGFAAVEACALDKPVIVSHAGSLPEVVSGKVAFVQAGSEQAIGEKVLEVYQNHYTHIDKKIFSWDSTIESTIAIYNASGM